MGLSFEEAARIQDGLDRLDRRKAQVAAEETRKREMLKALEEALKVLPKTIQVNDFDGKFSAYRILQDQGWLPPEDGKPMAWNKFNNKPREEIQRMLESAIAHLKKVLGVYVARGFAHEKIEKAVQ